MKRLIFFSLLLLSLSVPALADDGSIAIPLKDVSDTAKFYSFNAGATTVKYFLIKAPDNTVRSALDACDVCFPAKKGYKQTGEFMTCVNCGQKFHVSRVGMLKGGCNPHPVANTLEGDKVLISKEELAQGAKYFQ